MTETEPGGLTLSEGLQPFQGQDWRYQILIVIGGFVTWSLTYALVLVGIVGEPVATASSVEAVHYRRNTAAIASVVTGIYFVVLWTRAYGGPLLNILYLIGVEAFIPEEIYALGGIPPEHVVSMAGSILGLHITNPVWVRDYLIMGFPGVVVFFFILAYWIRSLTPDEERDFARNSLPPSWLRLRGKGHP